MKKSLLVLAISMVCIFCYGQDSNGELLKKLVEKNILTQDEADQIQKESKANESQPDVAKEKLSKIREAFNTPKMNFGGYGLFMYKYNSLAEVKHSAKSRAIFLYMQGELLKNVKYYVLAEVTSPELSEFYAEWTPYKEFGIRGGQMKTPLSLENQLSATVLETVNNSRSVSNLAGISGDVMIPAGKGSGGRDTGIRVNGILGSNDLLEYTVGLYQGTGTNRWEDNNAKDLAATLMLQPTKGFRIGGSAYFGEASYSVDNKPVDKHVRNRWMLSSDFKADRLYCRAEWLLGKDGAIDREGLYGTAVYDILADKLKTLVKVDYYNQNKDIDSEAVDYTLGVNYYFYKMCRLQVNYVYSDFAVNWNEGNSHSVFGQLQIVF